MPNATSQRLSERAHPGGPIGREIQNSIPVAAPDRLQIAIAITDQMLDTRRQIGSHSAAREHRHAVTPRDGCTHMIGPDVSGAAKDQDAQGSGCRARRCADT